MRKCELNCEAQREGFCLSEDVWGVDISKICTAKSDSDLYELDEICFGCNEPKPDGLELPMKKYRIWFDSGSKLCSDCFFKVLYLSLQ